MQHRRFYNTINVRLLRYSFLVHEQLKHLSRTISTERERLKQALASNHSPMPANINSYVTALKTSLAEVSDERTWRCRAWSSGFLYHVSFSIL